MGMFDAIASTVNTVLDIGNGWLTNAWSAGKAKDAWHRNLWMSDTAHQREVNDLRAAGLNPILSAMNGGNGASTIASPVPQAVMGKASLTGAASARIAGRMADIAEEKVAAEIDVLKSQALKNENEAYLAEENSSLASTRNVQLTNMIQYEAQKHDIDIANARIEAEIKLIERRLKSWGLSFEQYKGFYTQLFTEVGRISGTNADYKSGGGSIRDFRSGPGAGGKSGGFSLGGDVAGALDVALRRLQHEDNEENDFKSFEAVQKEVILEVRKYINNARNERKEGEVYGWPKSKIIINGKNYD